MKGLDVYDFEKAQDKENLMADIKAGKTLVGLQRQAFRDQQNQVRKRFNIYVHLKVCLHQIRNSFQMISNDIALVVARFEQTFFYFVKRTAQKCGMLPCRLYWCFHI